MRPLIGISTYREQARWGFWDVSAVLLPAAYADAVAAAGGEPVLLPTGSLTADVVARLDGLVLAGGADVDPARYGEEPGPQTVATRPDRDASEVAVLQAALDRIPAALTPSAWAEDGVVEGVEDPARRFCLAVQWHPEAGEDGRLFEALVAAAG